MGICAELKPYLDEEMRSALKHLLRWRAMRSVERLDAGDFRGDVQGGVTAHTEMETESS